MMYIEENLRTEIVCECDTLVLGGGVAGIAAALSCARRGNRVILAEREYMLGGLATAGLVNIYLPLDDGCGRQVSFGIAEELLKLSVRDIPYHEYGYDAWVAGTPEDRKTTKTRYKVGFNPAMFAVAAEQLLREAGVKLLYGTVGVAARRDGDRISCAVFENKSGRFAIRARNYIDASGDADLCQLCGAPVASYGEGNVVASWYYSYGKDGLTRHMLGFCDADGEHKETVTKDGEEKQVVYSGLSGEDVTAFTQKSHESLYAHVMQARREDDSYEPVTVPSIPEYRMTRRLCGAYTLDDTEEHTYFETSVGMVPNWYKRGPVYELPFEILRTDAVKNLLAAGRCVSCTDAMWKILRVIPCGAVMGEAAGVACSLTDDFSSMDIALLQQALRQNGVVIHEKDLG